MVQSRCPFAVPARVQIASTLCRLLVAGLLTVAGLAAPGSAAAGLREIANATVSVRTDQEVGSGFLFRAGDRILVGTCYGVVHDASGEELPGIEVALGSGTDARKVIEAEVIGATEIGERGGLAVLALDRSPRRAEALGLALAGPLHEGQEVTVSGFPAWEDGEVKERSLGPTVALGTLSGVRRDRDGILQPTELGTDLEPGNCGSPVVDRVGSVIGVAVEGESGEEIETMIPVLYLHRLLEGFVYRTSFKLYDEDGNGWARFDLSLQNPLHRITVAGVRVLPQSADPPVGAFEFPYEVPIGRELVSKGVSGDRVSLEAPLEFDKGRVLWGQVWFSRGGERELMSPIQLNIRDRRDIDRYAEALGATAVTKERDRPQLAPAAPEFPLPGACESPDPPAASGTFRRASTGRPLALPTELRPGPSLELNVRIADLVPGPDGRSVFALDVSDGRLLEIDLETLRIENRVEVPDAVALTRTPDGERIYVLVTPSEARRPHSVVHGFDRDLGKVGEVAVNGEKSRLAATDSGVVFLSGAKTGGGVVAVDFGCGVVLSRVDRSSGGSFLHLHPGETRLYVGQEGMSTPEFRSIDLIVESWKDLSVHDVPNERNFELGGDFAISPDGRYLFAKTGSIVKLEEGEQDDLRVRGQIPPFTAIAFSSDHSYFFVAREDATVSVYSMADLTNPLKTWELGVRFDELILDAQRRQLVAFTNPPADPNRLKGIYKYPRVEHPGDIQAFRFAP